MISVENRGDLRCPADSLQRNMCTVLFSSNLKNSEKLEKLQMLHKGETLLPEASWVERQKSGGRREGRRRENQRQTEQFIQTSVRWVTTRE